jgi:hypothetical protein
LFTKSEWPDRIETGEIQHVNNNPCLYSVVLEKIKEE